MTKLHIFDMDGTLLSGSACLDLSRHLGKLEAVNEMEEAWSRGELGHVEFYERLLPLWEGLSDEDVDEVFAAAQWVDGISEVWADIAARGELSAVISLSPDFFVRRLLRWGLGSVHAAGVEAGVRPDPALVVTPESKVEIAEALMGEHRLGETDCVAYGDSSSDIPLFRRLPLTVSVNGTESLRRVAAVAYQGSDLREAYAAGRSLLSRASSDPELAARRVGSEA
jgi:phosphoserine phosphatase